MTVCKVVTDTAKKRIPLLKWLPEYNSEKLLSDMIAGVTVGLTVIPQGLAYATLAGLEPQYGLYSAFMGCFVYAIFGSCKDITIGPTALMSLMTYRQVVNRNADFAVLLCFLSGCVQILLSILNLGVLIDFISVPVTVGFTSATSVIIAVSQVKGLLGLKFTSSGFVDTVKQIVTNIPNTRLNDSLLGFSCIVILLLMRKMKDIPVGNMGARTTDRQRAVKKTLWLVSTSRNALIVLFCSIIAFFLYDPADEDSTFILTGKVKSGLPEFRLPPFHTHVGNVTYSFAEMCGEMGSAIVMVPVIAVLGNVAIAKAFAGGDSIDATQELLTLGLCNLVGSFASSIPITGSFSRSAVNHASGVRTPLGGVYTGVLIILALSTLTPYFFYIPKASLAAVIICAVIFMIEYEVVKPMWKSNRKDLIPTFATFVLCLLIGVEYGILVGVAINIVFLLYPSARPNVRVEKTMTIEGAEYLLVTPGNSLYFPAVDYIRASVSRAASKEGSIPVVIDCRYVLGADFTAARGIAALIDDFNKRKQPIYFYQPCASVVEVFKGANMEEFIHACNQEELDSLLSSKSTKRNLCEEYDVKIEDVREASRLVNTP
ncbi:UNVERIFIED_CONTAM: hypothetical protein PYX00_000163 [Menopon gallinae]|uniref:Sodium-independent sulfate anion transporter n=1 Tax=Menopon gallinae TaxID=328185 RepID=A0AAW2I8Z9_9NEOP